MSNLHASSSSAQWQTDQVHENHTSTLYTSAAAVEAFVDKPLKSHDVIVFHKDNRFSLLPINTCTCLPSTWAIHQLSSFWFYTARHNVINANLYQIPDNHLHSITTQRPLYNNNTAFTTISSSLMMKKKFQPATILSAFTEPFRAHNGVSTRKYRFCHRRREFSLFTMHTRPKWSVLVSYITIFSAILLGNINKPVVKTHSSDYNPDCLWCCLFKKHTQIGTIFWK